MSFNIKGVKFTVSFSFFAVLLLFLIADKSAFYLKTLFYAVLHEAVHLIFISKLSSPPNSVKLSLFGGDIKRCSDSKTTFFTETAINISAPIFNILLGLLLIVLNHSFNLDLNEDVAINLTLGLFNILPYYNFDGGNALKNILLMRLSIDTTEKIITVLSVIVSISFALISVYIFINYQKNYILLIFAVYMLLMIIFKK